MVLPNVHEYDFGGSTLDIVEIDTSSDSSEEDDNPFNPHRAGTTYRFYNDATSEAGYSTFTGGGGAPSVFGNYRREFVHSSQSDANSVGWGSVFRSAATLRSAWLLSECQSQGWPDRDGGYSVLMGKPSSASLFSFGESEVFVEEGKTRPPPVPPSSKPLNIKPFKSHRPKNNEEAAKETCTEPVSHVPSAPPLPSPTPQRSDTGERVSRSPPKPVASVPPLIPPPAAVVTLATAQFQAVAPAAPVAKPQAVAPAAPAAKPQAVAPAAPVAKPQAVAPAAPVAKLQAVAPAAPVAKPQAVAPAAAGVAPTAPTNRKATVLTTEQSGSSSELSSEQLYQLECKLAAQAVEDLAVLQERESVFRELRARAEPKVSASTSESSECDSLDLVPYEAGSATTALHHLGYNFAKIKRVQSPNWLGVEVHYIKQRKLLEVERKKNKREALIITAKRHLQLLITTGVPLPLAVEPWLPYDVSQLNVDTVDFGRFTDEQLEELCAIGSRYEDDRAKFLGEDEVNATIRSNRDMASSPLSDSRRSERQSSGAASLKAKTSDVGPPPPLLPTGNESCTLYKSSKSKTMKEALDEAFRRLAIGYGMHHEDCVVEASRQHQEAASIRQEALDRTVGRLETQRPHMDRLLAEAQYCTQLDTEIAMMKGQRGAPVREEAPESYLTETYKASYQGALENLRGEVHRVKQLTQEQMTFARQIEDEWIERQFTEEEEAAMKRKLREDTYRQLVKRKQEEARQRAEEEDPIDRLQRERVRIFKQLTDSNREELRRLQIKRRYVESMLAQVKEEQRVNRDVEHLAIKASSPVTPYPRTINTPMCRKTTKVPRSHFDCCASSVFNDVV